MTRAKKNEVEMLTKKLGKLKVKLEEKKCPLCGEKVLKTNLPRHMRTDKCKTIQRITKAVQKEFL